MGASPNADRPVFGWTAILISFALVGVAVLFFSMARGVSVDPDEGKTVDEELALHEARRSLEIAALEVVALRMLDDVRAVGDRSARLATATAQVGSATERIEDLASGDGIVAAEAAVLLDAIGVEAADEADLGQLFLLAEDVARYSGADDVASTTSEVVQQLSFVSTLPLHVLIEGVAADVAVSGRSVDPSIESFMDEMIVVVREDGGWFGTDPATPLEGSVWIDIDEARELFPEAAKRLADLTAASDLVAYDRWMRDLGDGDAAPPFELEEMLVAADELGPELAAVIDELVVEDEAERAQAIAERASERRSLNVAAAMAGLLSLAGFSLGSWSISRMNRASRERGALAMRDALTGVGNRREFNERTRVLTKDPSYKSHLVAMIDFDLFKLINDVHGHAAGDAILVEVASRFQGIVDRLESQHAGVVGSVIRLGGDEFLIAVHSLAGMNNDVVAAELEAIRTSSIDYNGERIHLGFSIGLVLADGPHDIDDLMSAADLAVYDDKAARVLAREASRGGASLPR